MESLAPHDESDTKSNLQIHYGRMLIHHFMYYLCNTPDTEINVNNQYILLLYNTYQNLIHANLSGLLNLSQYLLVPQNLCLWD